MGRIQCILCCWNIWGSVIAFIFFWWILYSLLYFLEWHTLRDAWTTNTCFCFCFDFSTTAAVVCLTSVWHFVSTVVQVDACDLPTNNELTWNQSLCFVFLHNINLVESLYLMYGHVRTDPFCSFFSALIHKTMMSPMMLQKLADKSGGRQLQVHRW